jgi:signal peptidase I
MRRVMDKDPDMEETTTLPDMPAAPAAPADPVSPTRPPSVTKHRIHGLVFLCGGLFTFGKYVIIRETGFEYVAGIGSVAAGLAILWGLFLLRPGQGILDREHPVVEYYDAMALAIGIALVVRTLFFEPFKIPSGSMIPTLLVGDYLFVNKMAYGQRIPYTPWRLLAGDGPQRGDVAVFEYPRDPGKDYIKRIVALPGDRVVYDNKRLSVNGVPVEQNWQGTYTYINERGFRVEAGAYQEQLPAQTGPAHTVLVQRDAPAGPRIDEQVPPGYYFVMGDNRDNSNDSRFWGFVPGERMVGKAVRLFWSWDGQQESVRWDRLWNAVQ